MHDNHHYRTYCHQHAADIPLFHQPWWLDAVVGADQWQGLVSTNSFRGKTSILPVHLTRKWGFTKIRKPLLTTYQGPYWAGAQRLSAPDLVKLTQKTWPDLIEQIPPSSSFRHTLLPVFQYAFPFAETAYQLQQRYTYTLDLARSAEDLFVDFRRDAQRKVKKHASHYQLIEQNHLTDFLPLAQAVYQRQAQTIPFNFATLNSIFTAAQQRQQVKLFMLQNQVGTFAAGLLLFSDHKKYYLLVSGVSPAGRKTGAMQVLIWKTLQRLENTARIFDFCGSMIPQIAAANRGFGALPQPFIEVSKASRFLQLIGQR